MLTGTSLSTWDRMGYDPGSDNGGEQWGGQVLSDLHGEIIIKEAFDVSRTTFDYDTQDYAYQEVERLLDSAIVLLRHTDGAVDSGYLAQGDRIYSGNRTKWIK